MIHDQQVDGRFLLTQPGNGVVYVLFWRDSQPPGIFTLEVLARMGVDEGQAVNAEPMLLDNVVDITRI
jgi:hypothetical protein